MFQESRGGEKCVRIRHVSSGSSTLTNGTLLLTVSPNYPTRKWKCGCGDGKPKESCGDENGCSALVLFFGVCGVHRLNAVQVVCIVHFERSANLM